MRDGRSSRGRFSPRDWSGVFFFGLAAGILLSLSPLSAQNTMEITTTSTTPGSTATVLVLLTHDTNVQGFQTAMTWDNTILTLDIIDVTGMNILALLLPSGIEFYTTTANPALSPGVGWGAAAAIFDFSPPFSGQLLPPGNQQSLVFYRFFTVANPLLIGSSTAVTLQNNLGSPPLFNVITVGGSSVLPTLLPGAINFVDLPALKRGDANGDGSVNIADAINLIQYLFNNGPTPGCLEAADVNDDGLNDVSDAVFLIQFQFLDGSPPPAPYPTCGTDPNGASGSQCSNSGSC